MYGCIHCGHEMPTELARWAISGNQAVMRCNADLCGGTTLVPLRLAGAGPMPRPVVQREAPRATQAWAA